MGTGYSQRPRLPAGRVCELCIRLSHLVVPQSPDLMTCQVTGADSTGSRSNFLGPSASFFSKRQDHLHLPFSTAPAHNLRAWCLAPLLLVSLKKQIITIKRNKQVRNDPLYHLFGAEMIWGKVGEMTEQNQLNS